MKRVWIRQPWIGCIAALTTTMLAVLLHLAMTPILGETTLYHVFYLSVILTSAVWGRTAGLLAVVFGAAMGLWMSGVQSGPEGLSVANGQIARLVVFFGVGTAISHLVGRVETFRYQVKRQNELLTITLGSIGDGVIATDRQGRITFFNAEAERLTGWPQQEALGQPLACVFRVGQEAADHVAVDIVEEVLQRAATSGTVECLRLLARDGREILVENRGAPVFWPEGSVQGVVLVFRDVSEHKKAEEALRETAELRRLGLDAAELGTWDYDPQTLTLYWDDRCRAIFEVTDDHIPYSEFGMLIHPEDRPHWDRTVQASLDPTSDGKCTVEYRTILPDGSVRWCVAKGQTYFRGEGPARRALRMIGTVMDVTTQKEAEVALAQQKETAEAHQRRLQAVLDALPVAVLIADANGKLLATNPAVEAIWGREVPMSERIDDYRDDYKAWWPDTGRRVESHEWGLARALRTGEHRTAEEMEIETRDGRRKTILNYAIPIRNAQGAITGAVAVNVDITERRQAEESLRESEESLRVVFNGTYDAILVHTEGGALIDVNATFERMFGVNRVQALTLSVADIASSSVSVERLPEVWAKAMAGHPQFFPWKARRICDGSEFDVEVYVRRVRMHGREALLANVRDVTDRNQAEEELRNAKTAAEAANAAKSQFLANMSHELRTPMNSILGMTDLALQETRSPAVRDCLQTAKDSADSLLTLIDEILDLSRIEAGMLRLDSRPFSLRSLLDETVRVVSLRAFEKGLEFACDVEPEVPDHLVGDPLRLRQILTNLLGNAVKFTDRGEIVVRVADGCSSPDDRGKQPPEDDAVVLEFSVTDTGVGIAPEHRDRIFEPFVQADTSTTRHYGGSGLGLSIVSRLVKMLDGRLWLESQVGQGSTFFFTATLHRQSGPLPFDARSVFLEQLRGRSVLVAEPHPLNRRIVQKMLSGWSVRTVLAEDGPAVLAKLHTAANAGEEIPVAVLGVSLSGMNEHRLVKAIREDASLSPAIVLTVSPVEKQRLARQSSGLSGVSYLEKPISPWATVDAFAQAMGVALGSPPAAPAIRLHEGPATQRLRLLLVEDTPTNQKLAVHVLSRRGHSVVVAQNGQEALDRLRRDGFDVVLMDVQMPVMDGFQATREIRGFAQPEKACIPVIAMTAHALKGDEERCLAAGMDAYLSKPINGEELISLVERLARGRGQQRAGASCEIPARTSEQESPTVVQNDFDGPPFDLNEAVRTCYGKHELFQEIVTCFFDETDQLVARMRAALAEGQGEEVYLAAHRLKNTVVYLGASPAVEATRQVERLAKSGDLSCVGQAIDDLDRQLARLKAAIEQYRLPQIH